jgi:predicted SprT family Zn-dependent metalloprotease
MENRPSSQSKQVSVSDRVTFCDGRRTLAGHVARKGARYATVVTDDGAEFRVPYALLSRVSGAPGKHVESRVETLRAQFHASDRVGFALGDTMAQGTISRLNPKTAHIVCDDEREYRVPYALLQLQPGSQNDSPASHQRTDVELAAMAASARALIATHHLTHWSFQFDHATKRAGCCNYRDQVISLAHAYARTASDQAIQDTLLHEIAHARVGKAHGHDQVWRQEARRLGCSGQRCHDVQFSPPRYIVTCENACWVITAERRQRGAQCKTCHGNVLYMTYTEERWQRHSTDALP